MRSNSSESLGIVAAKKRALDVLKGVGPATTATLLFELCLEVEHLRKERKRLAQIANRKIRSSTINKAFRQDVRRAVKTLQDALVASK